MSETIKSYKGFNSDMTCRGFQYEEGKEYETDKSEVCKTGFHACELPFDVFKYYKNDGSNVFHEVEQSGKLSRNNDDSKVASTKIKIGAKINIFDMIKIQVKLVKEKAFKAFGKANKTSGNYSTSATSGDCSTSATSGNYSTSATSGNYSTSATSGYYSTSATSGYYSTSATSGDYSTSATSGDYSTSATSGNCSTSATSGYYSTSATSGDYSTSATSGNYSTSATSGYYSTSATSGNYSTSATSGYKSTSATSGDYSTSATSGNCSTSATSGYCSKAIANVNDALAVAWGYKAKAKGCLGSWLVLSEWIYNGNKAPESYEYRNDKDNWKLKNVITVQVDGEKVKPDTYYELVNNELVEVKD